MLFIRFTAWSPPSSRAHAAHRTPSSAGDVPYTGSAMSKQSMNTLAKWSARFSIERLFSPKQRHVGPRTVFVHEELPKDYYDHRGHVLKDHVYHPNQIISSKYTLFTFLPRNLLEQFRRIANMYAPLHSCLGAPLTALPPTASSWVSLSSSSSPSSTPSLPVSQSSPSSSSLS